MVLVLQQDKQFMWQVLGQILLDGQENIKLVLHGFCRGTECTHLNDRRNMHTHAHRLVYAE